MAAAQQDKAPFVHLVRGDDRAIVRDAVRELVDTLVDGGDRSMIVEETEITDATDDRAAQLSQLADAAQTPPFLTVRRVVVGRALHNAKADELTGLASAVAEP